MARRTLGEEDEALFDEDEQQAVLRQDLADALTPPPGDQTTWWPARGGSHRPKKPLSAVVAGFSLHAARTIDEDDREGLERLCRYGLRSPFSQERLSLLPDGRVVYRLARPWPTPTGRTEPVLDPPDFLRRLAALIPAPYRNMVRYHGVFANGGGRSAAQSSDVDGGPVGPAVNGGGRSAAQSSDVDGGPVGPAVNGGGRSAAQSSDVDGGPVGP
ncbi:MAG: transposase, partial [Myxococcota bacterium]|nr:transposase [Myxococcota bacterium]